MGSVPADVTPAPGPRPAARPSSFPQLVTRLAGLVLRPTPESMRGLALAAVIANAVIMSTGEAVRLSKSGLGCPDWPNCTTRSLVAASTSGQTTLNTWIEFGNRLLNFPLVAIAGLALSPACATGGQAASPRPGLAVGCAAAGRGRRRWSAGSSCSAD